MELYQIVHALVLYLAIHVCSVHSCKGYPNCSSCIQNPICDWCTKINMTKGNRCFNVTDEHECEENFRVNLKNNVTVINNTENSLNFMSPQEIKLTLRVGVPQQIHFNYTVQNYPLDLYILMDLSLSMLDDKQTLSSLRSALNETMRSITPDFRIGFGSFVDKDVLPFVSINNVRRTCDGKCEPAHGFINHLPLQDDIDVFIDKVNAIDMSGSLDNPEGGFDALMQVISCTTDIGWRENARKIILFATDETSHFAGDGKLAGIIRPNDASCHLNKNGTYLSTELDYPSVSQINFEAKEKSINIIFAVTETCYDWYNDSAKHIEGSSAAVLTNDSSNILSLIKEEYEKIVASIEMKDNASDPIKTVYYVEANEGHLREHNKIEGLKINSTASFIVNISAESCDVKNNLKFGIKPIGISSSFLKINLELICNCPCSVKGKEGYVENAEECNKHGALECGICNCTQNYFGHNCECDEPITNVPCEKDNETSVVCSGRGRCICGKCECNNKGLKPGEEISGKFCECDNFSCRRQSDNKICSGHGHCVCRKCQCDQNWSGEECECSLSKTNCTSPNGNLCSGNGNCTCGKCKCSEEYEGELCQKRHKTGDYCSILESCVNSAMTNTTNDKSDCNESIIELVDNVEDKYDEKNEILCYTSDYCHHKFVFSFNELGQTKIRAEKEQKCPETANISMIVFSIIGAILLLATIAILLWRILTIMYDRAKYAKFENDLKKSKFHTEQNPLFKEATTTYRNPTYSHRQHID